MSQTHRAWSASRGFDCSAADLLVREEPGEEEEDDEDDNKEAEDDDDDNGDGYSE